MEKVLISLDEGLKQVSLEIENLRKRMEITGFRLGLDHSTVLDLSKQLDELIVTFTKMKNIKKPISYTGVSN